MSKLDNEKQKKVFINNVFKIRYFRELPLEKFQVKKYDYHQLCFLLKYSPESMLYSTDRFADMETFDNQNMHRFFQVRYQECLKNCYNEEQLYYFYAISILGFNDILGQFTRNYTQTVKRAADNKRRYAPGWVHSTCLLRGFPKGAAPHLAHDFAEQSVVCYTLCRRCPENTVAAGEGKGI